MSASSVSATASSSFYSGTWNVGNGDRSGKSDTSPSSDLRSPSPSSPLARPIERPLRSSGWSTNSPTGSADLLPFSAFPTAPNPLSRFATFPPTTVPDQHTEPRKSFVLSSSGHNYGKEREEEELGRKSDMEGPRIPSIYSESLLSSSISLTRLTQRATSEH